MNALNLDHPPVEIRSFGSAEELAVAAARDWLEHFQMLAIAGKEPSAALSGGRIAKVFLGVAREIFKPHLSLLQKAHFFWADERCVPPNHRDSNYGLAYRAFLKPAGIPETQIHRIPGEFEPALAESTSTRALAKWSGVEQGTVPILDMVFLGMGEDGHVASLFPDQMEEKGGEEALFRAVRAPKPPPNRISMNYNLLQRAEAVWVMASGTGKLEALQRSLCAPNQTPLGRVLSSRVSTRIYTDICAADTFARTQGIPLDRDTLG